MQIISLFFVARLTAKRRREPVITLFNASINRPEAKQIFPWDTVVLSVNVRNLLKNAFINDCIISLAIISKLTRVSEDEFFHWTGLIPTPYYIQIWTFAMNVFSAFAWLQNSIGTASIVKSSNIFEISLDMRWYFKLVVLNKLSIFVIKAFIVIIIIIIDIFLTSYPSITS